MKDKILAIVRAKGPVIPKDLTKQLKLDTVFAGAHLSELVANKKLHVSTAKIGGSPVYYLPDDKEKLQMLYNYMNDKDKAAFDVLKQYKILRDIEQTPIIRVALRSLKDFSVPLTVNLPSGQELFWKWYLSSKDEAEHLIKAKMNLLPQNTQRSQTQTPQPSFIRHTSQHHERHLPQTSQQTEHHPATRHIEEEKQKIQLEKNNLEQEHLQLEKQKKAPIETVQLREIQEPIKKIVLNTIVIKQEPIIGPIISQKIQEPKLQEIIQKKRGRKPKIITQEKKELKLEQPINKELTSIKLNPQTQLTLQSQINKPIPEQITELNDSFLNYLKSYFDNKQIKIASFNLNRKNTDFDLIVSVPTPVGSIQYFCSAKNKQKCNEGDLSAAFVQAQSKKLNLLFLSTGELTKKAALMLNNEFKNQISYQQLEKHGN